MSNGVENDLRLSRESPDFIFDRTVFDDIDRLPYVVFGDVVFVGNSERSFRPGTEHRARKSPSALGRVVREKRYGVPAPTMR